MQLPLVPVLAVRHGTLAAQCTGPAEARGPQPSTGGLQEERKGTGGLPAVPGHPPAPACGDRHSRGIPLKCERGVSFEHSLEARPRLHEEKGCRPNPLELDSDAGGPGHSQRSRARAWRPGPFLGRRGLGEFRSGFLGPQAGFGRALAGLPCVGLGAGRGGWRLLSRPRAGGAVSGGWVPAFLGLSWWAGGRHPGPGRGFAGLALQSKGACPPGQARKKPRAAGVPLNNMVGTVDRTPAGLCAWFSVSVPVHHVL